MPGNDYVVQLNKPNLFDAPVFIHRVVSYRRGLMRSTQFSPIPHHYCSRPAAEKAAAAFDGEVVAK